MYHVASVYPTEPRWYHCRNFLYHIFYSGSSGAPYYPSLRGFAIISQRPNKQKNKQILLKQKSNQTRKPLTSVIKQIRMILSLFDIDNTLFDRWYIRMTFYCSIHHFNYFSVLHHREILPFVLRICHANSVCPSVRHTRVLYQNG